ncbi:hypothetical protein ACQ4M4_12205 [Leptolyngbya sp. AN02str]|uniref:hypothetical protein n=1 Tax=Leptolyngbya sp. AN02str TaxID=3423363 RepID=UPI003D3224ED
MRCVFLALSIAVLVSALGGCAQVNPNSRSEAPRPTPTYVPPLPVANPTPPPPSAEELWQEAIAEAGSAATLAGSAQSNDDWSLVADRWRGAIAQLRQIPPDAPKHAEAAQKISEYQRNLAVAERRANQPISSEGLIVADAEPSPSGTPLPSADGEPTSAATDEGALPTQGPTGEASQPTDEEPAPPEVALANHLRNLGAKMYSTYWCQACRRQEQLFGAPATSQLNIVECDARGENPQLEVCRAANVAEFPTWEINGEFYRGVQPLSRLAEISGYEGTREF